MIDTYLRPYLQPKLISPMADLLYRRNIHPLGVTLAGLVAGVGIVPLLAMGQPLLAAVFLLFSGYCDTLDGSLSRMSQQASSFGALCDVFSDRVVEFSVVLGLYLVDPTGRALSCLAMLGAILLCITTFLSVAIFEKNEGEKSFYHSCGLMERTEAFAFFLAMMLFPSYFLSLALLFTMLVLYTAFFRIWEFGRQ